MTIAVVERADAKRMGAYYTDARVAEFLVRWAVRKGDDVVLDPSFGGGVFLAAAAELIRNLGGKPSRQVLGIELSRDTFASVSALLRAEHQLERLHEGDFFDFASPQVDTLFHSAIPRCDAVVGNPPFIRYQRFTGTARRSGLRRASEEGVVLPELTSSWAPFVVHSASFLKPAGRLAMVVPYEIVYARYAKPVLQYLVSNFRRVTLLTFDRPLFPHLNESTVLLLAEGKGEPGGDLFVRPLADIDELIVHDPDGVGCAAVDVEAIVADEQRFASLHLSKEHRDLYAAIRPLCVRVESIADVGIGYVTGANDFFHVSPQTVADYALPAKFLAQTVCRGAALTGALFTERDWKHGADRGDTAYLLRLGDGAVTKAVASYLEVGISRGVPERYKCRSRKPWYRVPNVYLPDAFLTYMSGRRPRLVANEAYVFAPNTLHVVRLHQPAAMSARALAVLWQTSIAILSAEIEGHPMGGGLLKLEPREADRVLLPRLNDVDDLAPEIDALLREGRADDATRLADEATLIAAGVSAADCARLRAAAVSLQERRIRSNESAGGARAARRLGRAEDAAEEKGVVREAVARPRRRNR